MTAEVNIGRWAGVAAVLLAPLVLPASAARAEDAVLPAVDAFQAAFFDDATFTLHARSYLFDEQESSGTSDPAA